MTQPAAKALGVLLNGAAWLGKGKRPTVAVIEARCWSRTAEIEEEPETRADEKSRAVRRHQQTAVRPPEEKPKPAAKEKIAIEAPTPSILGESVFSLAADLELRRQREEAPPGRDRCHCRRAYRQPQRGRSNGARNHGDHRSRARYRVLGLEKNTSRGAMQVNVTVSGRNVRGEFCYHGDTFDMEMARQRTAFVKQAAHELAVKEETIQREVGKLWTMLGRSSGSRSRSAGAPPEEKPR